MQRSHKFYLLFITDIKLTDTFLIQSSVCFVLVNLEIKTKKHNYFQSMVPQPSRKSHNLNITNGYTHECTLTANRVQDPIFLGKLQYKLHLQGDFRKC